jgi:hypothetical protein
MSATSLKIEQVFVILDCATCGTPIALTQDLERRVRADSSRQFFCPHGHPNVFRDSEADRLRAKLAEQTRIATEMADRARRAEAVSEARSRELGRLKGRSAAGLCLCCNRTFAQLGRHMKTKHPDQAPAAKP